MEKASYWLAGIALFLILKLELLAALIAGLLVYELVHVTAPPLERRFTRPGSRVMALTALITVVILALIGAVAAVVALLKSSGGIAALLARLADTLDASLFAMPQWLADMIPTDVDALRSMIGDWLRAHARELSRFTGDVARLAAHVIIGMAIGAIVSLRHATAKGSRKPLAAALAERADRFSDTFRRVIFAQARISAINTAATAVYLLVLLPLFGVQLPFKTALVVITFITGLLPVIGNLISNVIIVIVSLSASLYAAIGSVVFLAVVHKLEYFLNAHIIGSRVNARPWELLAAMLALQAAFGIGGLIAAPFYYAYAKRELAERELV